MAFFSVEVGTGLKLVSYVMKVEAKTKKEAVNKVKAIGFNAGERLSSCYSGDFKPPQITKLNG